MVFFFIFFFILFSISNVKAKNCPYGYVPGDGYCDECGDIVFNNSYTQSTTQVLTVVNIKGTYTLPNADEVYFSDTLTCTGVIISKYTVLTLATCIARVVSYQHNGILFDLHVHQEHQQSLYKSYEERVDVYIGANSISDIQNEGVVKKSVLKTIQHPGYNRFYRLHDLGLIILTTPIEFNDVVKPICLPRDDYFFPNKIVNSGYLMSLNKVVLKTNPFIVHNASYCDDIYAFTSVKNKTLVCASRKYALSTSCGNFSNGLYSFDGDINKYVLIGISFYFNECDSPGIYTRISYFTDWIAQNWVTSSVRLALIASPMTCESSYFASSNRTCEECGQRSHEPNLMMRIVGGVPAVEHSWPAQVLVVMHVKGSYDYPNGNTRNIDQYISCGGTLINQRTVMTAAHCILSEFIDGSYTFQTYVPTNPYFDSFAGMFTVFLGVNDISFVSNVIFNNVNTMPAGVVKMSVSQVIKHAGYNDNYGMNDIALLILSETVELTETIQTACLPNPDYGKYPPDDTASFASGWGLLSESGASPSVLYNVQLKIYSPDYCEYVSTDMPQNWESQICSGEYDGGRGVCQGDSGSGLYVFDPLLNKYVVVGIISYGEGCARQSRPAVYTRVSYFNDWIRNNWMSAEPKSEEEITNATAITTSHNLLCLIALLSLLQCLNNYSF